MRTYSSAQELLNENSLPASEPPRDGLYRITPAMTGLELVDQLRDRRMSIPAILITSLPNENLRNRAAAGGVSLIEKPVFLRRSLIGCALRQAFER